MLSVSRAVRGRVRESTDGQDCTEPRDTPPPNLLQQEESPGARASTEGATVALPRCPLERSSRLSGSCDRVDFRYTPSERPIGHIDGRLRRWTDRGAGCPMGSGAARARSEPWTAGSRGTPPIGAQPCSLGPRPREGEVVNRVPHPLDATTTPDNILEHLENPRGRQLGEFY